MRFDYYSIRVVVFLLAFYFSNGAMSYGQTYGLGFASYETVQDKRTSLDLTPQKTLCFNGNFEMAFDMAFFPNRPMYFGYIFRIIENDKSNIDLAFNLSEDKKHPFKIVAGENRTGLSFAINSEKLYSRWTTFRIKFDFDSNKIIFRVGNSTYSQNGVHLKKNACYKILFGVNNYNDFRSTDTPPMKIRNIQVFEDGKVRHHWPLNEAASTIAHEIVAQNDALIQNPKWMAAMHHEWEQIKSFRVNGAASVAFDPKSEILYVLGTDTLYSYANKELTWKRTAYARGKIILNVGNQAVYDRFTNSLYSFYADQKFLSKYNPTTRSWSRNFTKDKLTNYWQVNKFISGMDSSLYILNGYGRHLYRNHVQQSNPITGAWIFNNTIGDFSTPRYLAALGTNANADTAYILGGFGSKTGQQIVNSKNIYDMMRFTVKDKAFKKLFNLQVKGEEFTFANSLIIDDKTKTYYGLVFPQNKYNSSLRLISGSLTNPGYHLIGNTIPYTFHDIYSFADLYYCTESKMFIAVTLFHNGTQTQVKVYSLQSPPYSPVVQLVAKGSAGIWPYAIGAAGLLLGVLYVYNKKRKKTLLNKKIIRTYIAEEESVPVNEIKESQIVKTEHIISDQAVVIQNNFDYENKYKNTILLFGDLQVFDADGIEITKHFSPLIKELFLIVLLYSLKRGRGVSSEKLNEILWYDKSVKSAGNNRAVNIAKLKSLLHKLTDCRISKDTGYWKIDIDFNHIYVDYYNYLSIVKDKKDLSIQKIKNLSAITQRGNFLSNLEYEWLDSFKSEISNEVIDTYLYFAKSSKNIHEPEFFIELANYIFYFDPVNEEAMMLKCKALVSLGKHSLAKQSFENFSKEYRAIYGEGFKRGFQVILE